MFNRLLFISLLWKLTNSNSTTCKLTSNSGTTLQINDAGVSFVSTNANLNLQNFITTIKSTNNNPPFHILSTSVSQISPTTCIIKRQYNQETSTTETLTKNSNGILQTFQTSSTKKTRTAILIQTTIDISWDSNMKWWMANTAPSDGPTHLSPFNPRTNISTKQFNYGGYKFGLNQTDGLAMLSGSDDGYVLPILTFLAGTTINAGLSFLELPNSSTTYATIHISNTTTTTKYKDTTPGTATIHHLAHFVWSRSLIGIGGNAKDILLKNLLATHEGCWRPALGIFWQEWKDYATPHSNVDLTKTEGTATYAYFFNQTNSIIPSNQIKYQNMDLKMNWDATFPWLYHGPWLPFENDRGYFPLGSTTPSNTTTTMTRKGEKITDATMTESFTWLNCDPAGHGGHAIRKLHPDWPKCMSQNDQLLKSWYDTLLLNLNVSTLIYGTLEEYGIGIKINTMNNNSKNPNSESCSSSANYTDQLICGANRLFQDSFPTAYLIDPRTLNPIKAAWDSVIVDFADSSYTEFLLNNTKHVVKSFGTGNASVAGVCLDRGDYIGLINVKAGVDDGVTTTPTNQPGRALVNSWKITTSKIAALLHDAKMALYGKERLLLKILQISFH